MTLSTTQLDFIHNFIHQRLQSICRTLMPYLREYASDTYSLDILNKKLLYLYSVFIAEIDFNDANSYLQFIHQKVDIIFKMWNIYKGTSVLKEFIQELIGLTLIREKIVQQMIQNNIPIYLEINTEQRYYAEIVLDMYNNIPIPTMNMIHYQLIWDITSLYSPDLDRLHITHITELSQCFSDADEIVNKFSGLFTNSIVGNVSTLNRIIWNQQLQRDYEMTYGAQKTDIAY